MEQGKVINRKLVATEYSTNFRRITKIITGDVPFPAPNQILIRNYYLGVNASDINYTAGTYAPKPKIPFTTGFESMGIVVGIGRGVTRCKVGDFVSVVGFGVFSDYIVTKETSAYHIPRLDPAYFLASALTASVALEQSGQMKSNQTILVTSAAGATGIFAVQLAKLAGNHVIGTCGSDEKIPLLEKLGCDRVINYRKESVNDVLRKEYPKGIDIIYETAGGELFDACLKNVAIGGRLIVIGMTSGYQTGDAFKNKSSLSIPAKLQTRSAMVVGFYLHHFPIELQDRHHRDILAKISENKLIPVIAKKFKDLDQIADAVDFLYEGKSCGKIVVELPAAVISKL